MKRIYLVPLLLITIIAAGLGVIYYLPKSSAGYATAAPQTAKVSESDFVMISYGTGILEGTEIENLYFSSNGVISAIPVKPGDSVQSGDLVAILNDQEKQLALQKSVINLEKMTSPSAISQIEIGVYQVQEALLAAETNLENVLAGPPIEYYDQQLADATETYYDTLAKYNKLKTAKLADALEKAKLAFDQAQLDLDYALAYIVPEEDIARAQAEVDLAAANLNVQKTILAYLSGTPLETIENGSVSQDLIEIKAAEWQFLEAQQALNDTKLIAPVAGTVTKINAVIGETVTANTPVLTISNPDQVNMHIFVDETAAGTLSIDDSVHVRFLAYPELDITARITSIDFSLVTVNGDSKIQAWAAFENPLNFPLPDGSQADIEVLTIEEENVLTIPYQALIKNETGDYQVIVLSNGQAEYRTVSIGMSDFASVVIKSGLSAGEIVNTNPISYVEVLP